ncbi:Protein of unknown function [Marinospirillum celere]|uniref:DUF2905 domain-containing protein n=1 Tax=Marinospirillum celere TaxID=1122252 RepID=A0A1I1EC45_9GAMM|nr:DUF2905 domain-containing protein [Marinospirillum celere]SFB82958.1 Protein of unknown function [Marinospirillum celere]
MQRLLFIIGLILILIALAWPWLKHLPLGRLPGDIIVQKPGFTFFLPITSMLLVSLVVSLLLFLFRR